MSKVVVIGGGASGLVASIFARKKGNEVILLERNNSCGKKILITGNGRCNYWNMDQDLSHYHSTDKDILESIMTTNNQERVLTFFESIGIIPKIKNGYCYPFSNQASSIKMSLLREAELQGVIIKNNFLVNTIKKENNMFIISSDNDVVRADSLILATGSCAAPTTGSDGMGYKFATNFGHSLIPVLPSLCSLIGNGNYFKKWSGVRTDVEISLYSDNKFYKKEIGEIQLTDYGISGICTFNLSSFASILLNQKEDVYVEINFIPFIKDKISFYSFLEKQSNLKYKNISELLEGILNYKLVDVILRENNINSNINYYDLSDSDKDKLFNLLTKFHLDIIETSGYDKAQVCSGGIPLTEVNPNTMESKKETGLYIVGELLDVNGDCGGYNLSFSWISGMLAGIHVGE